MRRLRSLFLVFIALWLPLQAASAWTMPLCSHAANMESSPCHQHDDASTLAATSDFGCDNCGICHLASTGFLLAGLEPAILPQAASVLVSGPVNTWPSHIPPPPQQPPRR